MIAISVLALIAAWRLWQQLAPRLGSWNGAIVAGLVFVAVIAVAELILPGVQETPRGFPADVLWHFRITSSGSTRRCGRRSASASARSPSACWSRPPPAPRPPPPAPDRSDARPRHHRIDARR